MTSYECARRLCTEMYEFGLLSRTKVEKGSKGRPSAHKALGFYNETTLKQ